MKSTTINITAPKNTIEGAIYEALANKRREEEYFDMGGIERGTKNLFKDYQAAKGKTIDAAKAIQTTHLALDETEYTLNRRAEEINGLLGTNLSNESIQRLIQLLTS